MKDNISVNSEAQVADMKNYYKFQAKIYDLTRWTFLFGRFSVLRKIPIGREKAIRVLDVGCGTGVNSLYMAKLYPNARITSLDVSADMLDKAKDNLKKYADRVELLNEPYERGSKFNNSFDIILFSYSLTMINPMFSELIDQAQYDLKPEGYVVVADFHDTKMNFYKKFMRSNHVRLDGQLMPLLKKTYEPFYAKIKNGYLGVWQYMMFIGKKKV